MLCLQFYVQRSSRATTYIQLGKALLALLTDCVMQEAGSPALLHKQACPYVLQFEPLVPVEGGGRAGPVKQRTQLIQEGNSLGVGGGGGSSRHRRTAMQYWVNNATDGNWIHTSLSHTTIMV